MNQEIVTYKYGAKFIAVSSILLIESESIYCKIIFLSVNNGIFMFFLFIILLSNLCQKYYLGKTYLTCKFKGKIIVTLVPEGFRPESTKSS